MFKVIILPKAAEDILAAAKWYNSRQKGLGKRFTAKVREKVHFIKQNPTAVPIRYNEVRTALLDTFPYMVYLLWKILVNRS